MKYNQINDRLTIYFSSDALVFVGRLSFFLFSFSKRVQLFANRIALAGVDVCVCVCVRNRKEQSSGAPDVESICSSDIYSTHTQREKERESQSVGNLFGCELMMPGIYIHTHWNIKGRTHT
jgi:hypothetical protein